MDNKEHNPKNIDASLDLEKADLPIFSLGAMLAKNEKHKMKTEFVEIKKKKTASTKEIFGKLRHNIMPKMLCPCICIMFIFVIFFLCCAVYDIYGPVDGVGRKNGPPILSLLQDGYKKADFLKENGDEKRIEKMESQIQGLEYGLDEMSMELRQKELGQKELEKMKGEMKEMKGQFDELNRTVTNMEPDLKAFAREMMEFVGKMLDEKMANLKKEIEKTKAKKENLKEDGIKNGLISLRAKVNGKFVTAEEKGNKSLVANREAQKEWELFRLFKNDDGTISFRSLANEKFVRVDLANERKLIANGNEIGVEEKFTTDLGRTPDSFVLKSKATDKFVGADLVIGGILVADRDEPKSWEQFELIY